MEYLGDIICISLDSLIFGICLRAYLRNKHALRSVESAPEMQVDNNLVHFLDEHGGKFPYIAIRGNIRALSPPIKSMNHPYVVGVVQKLSIKEHVVSRSSSGFWTESQRTINEVFNSIPFALTSKKGNVEIEVIDALAAEILDLEVISDRFDPSNLGFMDHMWGFFTGVRKRGLQTVEEVLKEGAFITAVGEIQKDGSSLRIQPPSDGTPFFVSTMPITSLVRRLDEKANYYGWISFGFGIIGLFLCGSIIRKFWKKHKERLKKEAERRRLESTRKEEMKPKSGKLHLTQREAHLPAVDGQLINIYESLLKRMIIPWEENLESINPKEIILLPCGHVCLCEDCNEQITNCCPICKSVIESSNPAYIA